ncbi:hypothetical protein [Microbulbifer sp. HZ11]|uniref:SCO family protein n=1 Tax=unclassified Microbulbifer TaxID=2619833 RepID=UPI0005B7C160|nr:hypothetical protein [Microbulbifer sp. HZ11]
MTEQVQAEQATGLQASSRDKPSGLGRWTGIGVVASVVLPIVAAYVIFYTGLGMPSDTVNQGELLIPAQSVAEIDLRQDDGAPLSLVDAEPRWRYLILGDAQCSDECEQLLYTTRQVHIRLGDKARRVERVLATGAPLSKERLRDLANQHPKLRFSSVEPQQLDQWLADSDHAGLTRPSVLLVDQQGYAMMVYNNSHSGNQLLKDIKRMLKYSYEK